MKFDKACKIEGCASDDTTRTALANVYYEPERKRLMATDGHCAVILPVFPDEGDHAGPISADALKAARKAAGKSATLATVLANGAQVVPGGPTFPRPPAVTFPPMDAVIPAHRPRGKGTVTFAVNVDLLAQVAAAMGTTHVTLTITRPDKKTGIMLDPIVVLPNYKGVGPEGPLGLVMPMAPWYRGEKPDRAIDTDDWADEPTSPDITVPEHAIAGGR